METKRVYPKLKGLYVADDSELRKSRNKTPPSRFKNENDDELLQQFKELLRVIENDFKQNKTIDPSDVSLLSSLAKRLDIPINEKKFEVIGHLVRFLWAKTEYLLDDS